VLSHVQLSLDNRQTHRQDWQSLSAAGQIAAASCIGQLPASAITALLILHC
jgi:hypothetical protein